ncbi:MAG: hypothetical protein CM15mP82_4300 [Methanobacteriota archaeon]|nr:MAG: hypothetical protein CM15mP82_4300 [Euryarchaeota archaeon]
MIDDSEKDLSSNLKFGVEKGEIQTLLPSPMTIAFPGKDWVGKIIDEFLHNDVDFIGKREPQSWGVRQYRWIPTQRKMERV